MPSLESELDALAAEKAFSGVGAWTAGTRTLARAYGYANRACEIPNAVDTRFATASGSKSLTASRS